MTDNLPVVAEPSMHPERRALVNPATDSWVAVVEKVASLAAQIADTEFVPKGLRGKPAAVAAAILYGREIGLGPMTSLAGTDVIEGKPGSSAELMRSLVLAAGHEYQVMESTGAICTIRGKRKGHEQWSAPITWTLDMARAAELTGKSNWKRYPRAMLLARASAEMCHRDFPDVIHGLHAAEELEAGSGPAGAPAGQDGAGTTVQRKRRQAPPKTGDGAARTAATPPGPVSTPSAPSPLPPLPGEAGYGDTQTDGADPTPAAPDVAPQGSSAVPSPPSDEGAGAPPDTAPAEATATPAPSSDPDAPQDVDEPRMMSRGMQRAMFAAFGGLGIDDDDERMAITEQIIGRTPMHKGKPSSNGLTADEGAALLDTLGRVNTRDELVAIITASAEARKREAGDDD